MTYRIVDFYLNQFRMKPSLITAKRFFVLAVDQGFDIPADILEYIADAFRKEIKDYDEATKDEDGLSKKERKDQAMVDMMFAIENREEGVKIKSIIQWFAENRWEDLGLRHKGDDIALSDRWKRFKK